MEKTQVKGEPGTNAMRETDGVEYGHFFEWKGASSVRFNLKQMGTTLLSLCR